MSITNSKDTVTRLQRFNNSSVPILSVYFHLPVPNLWTNETITNKLSAVINHDLSFKQRQHVQKNIEYILGFIEKYQQKNGEESLAFFSGGDSLFEILHLSYKVTNKAVISHSPFLQPILEQESVYRRYLVILVDREKARLILMSQGLIEGAADFFDPSVPQNVHASMREDMHVGREQKINRHIEDHLNKHCLLIANGAQKFLGNNTITGIIIGGNKNMFQKFEHHLPKNLQEKVVAEFVAELDTNLNELVLKSKKIISEIDTKLNNQIRPFLLIH